MEKKLEETLEKIGKQKRNLEGLKKLYNEQLVKLKKLKQKGR